MGKFEDLTGKQFGEWTVLKELGNRKILCKCSCGKEKIQYKKSVKSGVTKSCGHNYKRIDIGDRFEDWEVINIPVDNSKLAYCKCSCGIEKLVTKASLVTGRSKSCGHSKIANLEGKHFGEWEVLEEKDNYKVLARCSCGVEKEVNRYTLINGKSNSCGHDMIQDNLTNKHFGEWEVIKELGNGKVLCRCSCGTERINYKNRLKCGRSMSCGCKNNENRLISKGFNIESIEIINDEEKIKQYINTNYKYSKPSMQKLANDMGIGYTTVRKKLLSMQLHDIIDYKSYSFEEKSVYDYICSICNNVEVECRTRQIIPPKELDIYIPDKKIAIEFNGSYWHSDIFKDKYYHQDKTIDCAKKGIRLIHIFDYEWNNEIKQQKIKNLLNTILTDGNKIHVINTEIKEIDDDTYKDFIERYHLQGYVISSIRIGCYYNDKLIGVMAFGTPRFNDDYQYELLRLCWYPCISIVGGAEKMFEYFILKYKPLSIVTYSDISKFTGNVYLRLGFTTDIHCITEPNYVWVNNNLEIFSRYQTQQKKLIRNKLDSYRNTEDEIMNNLDYFKVYNCGNIKLSWKK